MAPRESLRKEQYQSPDWAKSLVVCSTHHERRHSSLETRENNDPANLHASFACDGEEEEEEEEEEDSRVGLSICGPSDSVSDMSTWAGASQLKPILLKKNSLPTLRERESSQGGINQRLSKSTAVPVTPDPAASALGIAQRLVGDLAVLCQDVGETTQKNSNYPNNHHAPPKELICPEGDHSVSAISTPSTLLRYPDSPLHTLSTPGTFTDTTTVSSYGTGDDSNPQFLSSSVSRFSSMRRYQKLQVPSAAAAAPPPPPKERKIRRTFSLPSRQDSKVACLGTPNTEDTSTSKQPFPQTLYDMIERCDPSIAHWSDDGNSFVVRSVVQFEKEVLPQFFPKSTKFGSFLRMLNFFSFRKIKHDDKDQTVVFEHKDFRRGRPQLLGLIRRRTSMTSNISKTSRDEEDMSAIPSSGSFSLSRRDSLRDQMMVQVGTTPTTHHHHRYTKSRDSVYSFQTHTEQSTTVSEACARTHREMTLKKWKRSAQRQLAVLPANYPRCEKRDAVSKDALGDLLEKLYHYFQAQDVDAKHDPHLATFGLVLCTTQQCELHLLVWYTDESKSSLYVEVDMIKHKSGGGCQGSFPIDDVHQILRTVKSSGGNKPSNHKKVQLLTPSLDVSGTNLCLRGDEPPQRLPRKTHKDEIYSPKSRKLSLPTAPPSKGKTPPTTRRSLPGRVRTFHNVVSDHTNQTKLRRSLPATPTFEKVSSTTTTTPNTQRRSLPGRVKSYQTPRLSQILDVRYRKL